MMIRVNGEYLDFNDDIEIESQVKLFEEISTSNGDFSYSFELPTTSKNLKALGFPFPDTVKSIYSSVPCDIVDDSGYVFNSGGLQVNRANEVIEATFFGGNNNWFSLIIDPLESLPLNKYDVTIDSTSIVSSWSANKGIVFPLIDSGTLITRSYSSLKIEDFVPCFYVKTLFNEIFGAQGIKLEGDLINDSLFNQITIAANSKDQEQIESRACYVNKTTAQTAIIALTKITFQDETTFPFFDGSKNNFSSSTYTADLKMFVTISINLGIITSISSIGRVYFYINGVAYKTYALEDNRIIRFSKEITVLLQAGDTFEVYATDLFAVGVRVNSGSFKVKPIYIYKAFGKSSVPKWTQLEFVSSILEIFNVIPFYNAVSKTLTLDLFNKIQEKTPIDVSADIRIVDTDFSEFISSYANENLFSYQEGSDEDLREYNISNFIKYGSGAINIENDFIERSANVVESDLTSPITYLNGVFDMSMERINFTELDELDGYDITSVSNSSGVARFNIGNADDYFTAGDLARIDTGVDTYDGDWVVDTVTSTYITVKGLGYDSNSTGTAITLRHKFTTDDSVYMFANIPNLAFSNFSSIEGITLDSSSTVRTSIALAYFNILSNGKPINSTYKQSLSFGVINNENSNQLSLIDTYWGNFGSILNDPVLLRVLALFKRKTYLEIKSFLRPLRIKTNRTNNLYYLNRITGYKSGHEACEGELIKL